MKITKTPISDLIILEPKIFGDDRGYFIESFQENGLLKIYQILNSFKIMNQNHQEVF